eukprot:scaffold7616_cov136-Skeletonema_marinoi.AAC.2
MQRFWAISFYPFLICRSLSSCDSGAGCWMAADWGITLAYMRRDTGEFAATLTDNILGYE